MSTNVALASKDTPNKLTPVKRMKNGKKFSKIYENNLDQFNLTRRLFYRHFDRDLFSYEEWLSLQDDEKAAALYLMFFKQITLAWYKVKSSYAIDDEGVETVLQYLEKNVPLIEANSTKYSPRYVYRVAYNCLSCISYGRKIDLDRYNLETSNIQYGPDGEFNLYDSASESTRNSDIFCMAEADRFWKIVEDVDEGALDVAIKLINGQSLGRTKKAKQEAAEIIEKLKIALAEYTELDGLAIEF